MRLAIQNTLLVSLLGAPSAERAEATSSAATARALPCRPSMQCLVWLSGAPRGVPARRVAGMVGMTTAHVTHVRLWELHNPNKTLTWCSCGCL